MSFVQVYLARNEMEASIVKGNLEGANIQTTISPGKNHAPLTGSCLTAQGIPYGVYVKQDKVEEVKKILGQEK